MPKHKCPPAGAPEWVLTYGDMMSLLLCFFILLAAMSELKKDLRPSSSSDVTKLAGSPAAVAGPEGAGSSAIGMPEKNNSFIPLLDAWARQREIQREQLESNADQMAINPMPPETLYQIGGAVLFEPFSTQISGEASLVVDAAVEKVRGYATSIEIRGHASVLEKRGSVEDVDPRADLAGPDNDLWNISHARAVAVMKRMVAAGIPLSRIKITAAGDSEPLRDRLYSHGDARMNRRVEVLLSNHMGTRVVRKD